jgi:hypothetical protein
MELICKEFHFYNNKIYKTNLDETYDFKVEPKGSWWYNIYGKDAEKINKKTQEKLTKYKQLYKKQNNKALITTI